MGKMPLGKPGFPDLFQFRNDPGLCLHFCFQGFMLPILALKFRNQRTKLQTQKEANRKRLLKPENKLEVDGGWGEGKVGEGHGGGHLWG